MAAKNYSKPLMATQSDDLVGKLSNTPKVYRDSIANMECCRQLCNDLGCDSTVVRKIDQCAADQHQLARHSSVLAKQVFSVWIPSYIKAKKGRWWQLKRTKKKKIDALRAQAKELSTAFKEVAGRARKHAGDLHDVHEITEKKAEEYRQLAERAAKEAGKQRSKMSEATRVAANQRKRSNEKADLAGKLKIAAVSTFFLPPLAIGLGVGAKIASKQSDKAEEKAEYADRTVDGARSAKRDAECRQDNFQVRERTNTEPIHCFIVSVVMQYSPLSTKTLTRSTVVRNAHLILGSPHRTASGRTENLRTHRRRWCHESSLVVLPYGAMTPFGNRMP